MVLKLSFDKGTLLFSRDSDTTDLPSEVSNLFTWDDRVRHWRTCASNYRLIVERCKSAGVQIDDNVFKRHSGQPHIENVSLRPYQEVAVLNWEQANRTGIVCLPTGAGKTRIALAIMART